MEIRGFAVLRDRRVQPEMLDPPLRVNYLNEVVVITDQHGKFSEFAYRSNAIQFLIGKINEMSEEIDRLIDERKTL